MNHRSNLSLDSQKRTLSVKVFRTTNLYPVYTVGKLYYEDFYPYIVNVDFIYITEVTEVLQKKKKKSIYF